MRLTIFGASGKTGRHLRTQALDAGHTVTAVVRDPTRLPIHHQRLQVVTADVLDPAAIQPPVAGADAVISALGPYPPRNRSSIMSAATASILAAMRATGTSRLVVISAAPVATDDHGTTLGYRLLAGPLLRLLLGGLYADMASKEEAIRRSGVDWTILRPPWLSDESRTGTWRQAKDSNLRGAARFSRADLAEAILASLQDPDTVKATIADGGRRWINGEAALGGLLGIVVVLGQALDLDVGRVGWPFLVITPGLGLLGLGLAAPGRPGEVLAMVGGVVTVNGLVLGVQTATGRFQTWAYAWTLVFVVGPGIGRWLVGVVRGHGNLAASGGRLLVAGREIGLLATRSRLGDHGMRLRSAQ